MQQHAHQVAAVPGSFRCLKSEGSVWTMLVVVLGVDPQDLLQVLSVDHRSQSSHSARTVPIHRSATAFALGACTA
jgi:hypothetical protein